MDSIEVNNALTIISIIMTVISILLSAVVGWGILRGHYVTLTARNRDRKIEKIHKEFNFVVRARDSDREFYTFVLRYAFMVACLLGMYMMFSGMDTTGQAHKFNLFIRFVIGTGFYLLSAYALANIVRIKNWENTLDLLNNQLRKLGAEPLSTAPTRPQNLSSHQHLHNDN